jgi:hypothetical protein
MPLVESHIRYTPLLRRLPSGIFDQNMAETRKNIKEPTAVRGGLMDEYSQCLCTADKDRVPAVAGIMTVL